MTGPCPECDGVGMIYLEDGHGHQAPGIPCPECGVGDYSMRNPQQTELPAYLMRAIELIVADQDTGAQEAYTSAVLITFGWALYQRQTELEPGSVQIPDEQWREICQWLMDRGKTDPIDRVNWGLSWMNQGPSTYVPAKQGT